MRAGVNVIVAHLALVWIATGAPASIASAAESEPQQGDGRWVPSLAVTSGVLIQRMSGTQSSFRFDNTGAAAPQALRLAQAGSDQLVAPYVGAAIELMTPAVPIPSRPRAFVAGEILPTFSPESLLSFEGNPSRIRGPEVGAVLWFEEDNKHYTSELRFGPGPRTKAFTADEARGQGMRNSAEIRTLAFGAKAGISFAFGFRNRPMRIKPAFGWIHYQVAVKGFLVHPTCVPVDACTNTYNSTTGMLTQAGFLRETILRGHDSGVFDGFGPGVDLEMDVGRFGPIGSSLFIGGGAYYIPGNRSIRVVAKQAYNDRVGNSTDVATWTARVTPWIYRAGLGIRFQWLGNPG